MNEQIYLDHARARMEPPPAPAFVCRPEALGRQERARHADVTRQLLALAGRPRELADGYAFAVGADRHALELAAEFVARERLCCPFLSFRLDAGADATAWLHVTGPDGVKPFLRAELDLD